jgi:hypothetical protein
MRAPTVCVGLLAGALTASFVGATPAYADSIVLTPNDGTIYHPGPSPNISIFTAPGNFIGIDIKDLKLMESGVHLDKHHDCGWSAWNTNDALTPKERNNFAPVTVSKDGFGTAFLGPLPNGTYTTQFGACMAYAGEYLGQAKVTLDGHPTQPNRYAPVQLVDPSLARQDSTPLQPVQGPPVMGNDVIPPSSAVDCTKLRAAYDSLGPVTDTADAVAKLKKLKIPGISQVEGVSLALCGLDAIPAAINNPSPDNQQRVFDSGCGAIDEFTSGVINPCGDTPAG